MPVTIHYRIQRATKGGHARAIDTKRAAEIARLKLLEEWDPPHWHLASVSEMEGFFGVAFNVTFHEEEHDHWNGDHHLEGL